MNITLKRFKSIISEFNKIKNFAVGGSVCLETDNSLWDASLPEPERSARIIQLTFREMVLKNLASACAFVKAYRVPKHIEIKTLSLRGGASKDLPLAGALKGTKAEKKGHIERIDTSNSAELAKKYGTMRFIPQHDLPHVEFPYILRHAPLELMEGNRTFRVLCSMQTQYDSAPSVCYISQDTDADYDYLDQGFYILDVYDNSAKAGGRKQVITSNQLDIHTMHIFVLCQLQPKLAELLPESKFIQVADAQMTRLRMEKKLNDKLKARYSDIHNILEKDYQSNTTLLLLYKLINKEVDKIVLNDITLTSGSATYNQISIEAADLLDILYKKLNFGGEYDIYSIIGIYASDVEYRLDALNNAAEIPKFKINGFEIAPEITMNNVRKINGRRINKDEINQVIYRASCHHEQAEYDLFLRRVSKLSLRRSDALTNGLAVKIHDSMCNAELRGNDAPATAPAIKFFIDTEERRIKLKTTDPKGCPVRLGALMEKIKTINRTTNGGWSRNVGVTRDYRWARRQLVKALRECTTFDRKVKNEDGTERIESVVGITDDDIAKVIAQADEHKKVAIARSKDFLATAVKFTGAEEIEFSGKRAYRVDGALRKYAVVIETAKVYDYETGQYRCIVNDRHYRGFGYDDVAARLYALKNDSVMQKKIGTLQGAAQPNAEGAHRYEPARDVEDQGLEELLVD
jgi:hypothetical protein